MKNQYIVSWHKDRRHIEQVALLSVSYYKSRILISQIKHAIQLLLVEVFRAIILNKNKRYLKSFNTIVDIETDIYKG